MNNITQDFIKSINGKPDREFLISTECESINGSTYATLWIAQEVAKELKRSGYGANVLDNDTGEILFVA